MKHYLILMKPLLREMMGSLGQNLGGRRKKKKKTLSRVQSVLLYVFILLVLAFYSVIYAVGLTKGLIQAGSPDGFITMLAAAAPMMVLVFGILQVIPLLFHESSIETLLVLPLKPSVIIAGKLSQAYPNVLLLPAAFFFPGLIAHGIMTGRPLGFYLLSLPFLLLVTLAPFALLVILVLILMRYTRFARDKDRFQMITSVIVIVAALGISLSVNMMQSGDGVPGASLASGGGLSGLVRYLPSSFFGAAMLQESGSFMGLLYGLASLAVNLIALGLLFALAGKLYLPGVMGMKSGGKKAPLLSRAEQNRSLAPRSAYRAILSKDLALLFRTPAFFTQTVLSAILIPPFIIGVFVFSFIKAEGGGETASLLALLRAWARGPAFTSSLWILVMAVSAIAAFFAGTNVVSASAISRQGLLFSYSKLMPVPVRTQLLAWLTPGLVSMTLTWLILTVAATLFLSASPLFGLLVFLIAWVNAYLIQITGFYTDMAYPRLDWTNEIQAVKNTRAAMVSSLGMFAYIGAIAGIGFLAFKFSGGSPAITAAVLLLLILAAAGLMTRLVIRRAHRLMLELDV